MLGLLDIIPAMIFVVDDDVRLLNFNRTSTQVFGLDKDVVFRRRGGDVLNCVHSHDDPDGCGKGPHCHECVMRNSVNAAIANQEVSRRYSQLSIQESESIRNIDCLITTAPIIYDGSAAVLLVIEDISEIAQLRKLVPMCAWCKKIRDDKQYWETVDKYMTNQLNIDLTHGICPDCQKKMQEEIDQLYGK